MKELIVFTALVILALTTLGYQADINKMQLASLASKNLCQEIVFGAGIIESNFSIVYSSSSHTSASSSGAISVSDEKTSERIREKALEKTLREYADDSVKLGVKSDYLSKVDASILDFDISTSGEKMIVRLSLEANYDFRIPFSEPPVFKSEGSYCY